ncbi:MAG: type II toxin-antitoxin system prevent-host-death family antitoxin [Candidatus Pacebacteria bacterium]|nr:type II toxin-antitoxin system prevent-host-death family antitoxin [Candidatus Paceibacterota bacterium]MCF7862450.1 type II toxin-antitoxin system prevent-host-death family antitoxin [Candidatus Paceibacterota bacterium]
MSLKTKEKIIGFKDLRENADKYINAIAKGKSFTVVRRSKPIFKIVPVDEWGDEGEWDSLVDFTKLSKKSKGILAEEVLESLKRIKDYEKNR